MKHQRLPFKALFTSAFLFFFCGSVSAQIQVTTADIMNLKGKTIVTENDDRFSFNINVGMPGANQTWDFTGQSIPNPVLFISEYSDPQGTPFDTAFTDANLAGRFSSPSQPGFATYEYYDVEQTLWTVLGMGTILPPPFDSTFSRRQPTLASPLPITMNSGWTTVASDTTGDYPSFATIDRDSCVIVVDGWGTVITPLGSYQCLRFKEKFYSQSITIVNGVPISFGNEFYWIYRWINGDLLEIVYAQSDDGEPDSSFTTAIGYSVISQVTTGIDEITHDANLVQGFQLDQNYPNPFNPTTTIRFSLPQSELVQLSIYNQIGQRVETLLNEQMATGTYTVNWNAEALPSGVYFYRLQAGSQQKMRKAILLK